MVVVDWKRPDLTCRCLRSLLEQGPEGEFEIVLVMNEADAPSVASLRAEFPSVVVLPQATNTGFATAVDIGVAASRGSVVVLLNNDAVALPGFVESLVSVLESAPAEVAATVPTVLLEGTFAPADGDDGDEALVGLAGERWIRRDDDQGVRLVNGTGVEMTPDGNGHDRHWLTPVDELPEELDAPFGFSGGAAAIRRTSLDAVGGFDPSLFMYYEDLDVSWRLRLAGFEMLSVPDAVVLHRHAGSSSSSGDLVRFQSMRNRLAVVLRNGSWPVVARVALRTLVRAGKDALGAGGRQLSTRQWARLLRQLPALTWNAVRLRRRDAVGRAARARVEALLRR